MPRPRALSRFPAAYRTLFERAVDAPVRIRTSSPASAERLRTDLYTYRTSLQAYFEAAPRLALMSLALCFSIEKTPKGAQLLIELAGESKDTAKEIKEATDA